MSSSETIGEPYDIDPNALNNMLESLCPDDFSMGVELYGVTRGTQEDVERLFADVDAGAGNLEPHLGDAHPVAKRLYRAAQRKRNNICYSAVLYEVEGWNSPTLSILSTNSELRISVSDLATAKSLVAVCTFSQKTTSLTRNRQFLGMAQYEAVEDSPMLHSRTKREAFEVAMAELLALVENAPDSW